MSPKEWHFRPMFSGGASLFDFSSRFREPPGLPLQRGLELSEVVGREIHELDTDALPGALTVALAPHDPGADHIRKIREPEPYGETAANGAPVVEFEESATQTELRQAPFATPSPRAEERDFHEAIGRRPSKASQVAFPDPPHVTVSLHRRAQCTTPVATGSVDGAGSSGAHPPNRPASRSLACFSRLLSTGT